MIKFLPSFVGSKQYWVSRLQPCLNNIPMVELFCGSSVLSANLASTAVLNDLDPMVSKILSRFDEQIVPEIFTQEDYFRVRKQEDWWRYAFCLQKMSFSGVFRYSKNGYNVPVKKQIESVELQEDYEKALCRWRDLSPTVLNVSYTDVPMSLCSGRTVILDPPYSGSKASYNTGMNYEDYWSTVGFLKKCARSVLLFDRVHNFQSQDIPIVATRKMRVAGHYDGDVEAIAVSYEDSWLSSLEELDNC